MQTSAPAAPSDSSWKMYAKAGGIYARSSNAEVGPFGATGSAFVGAKAYNSTTQAVSDSTATTVTFNSEEYDTSSFHDTGSNTGRMTVPTTGYYRMTAYVYFDAVQNDVQIIQFLKNGTTLLRSQTTSDSASGAAGNIGMINHTTASLSASDYVEVRVYNFGHAATIGDSSNSEQQCFFEIQFLGS